MLAAIRTNQGIEQGSIILRHKQDVPSYVKQLWRQGIPPQGTPVEQYLKNRAIRLSMPASIRYLPSHIHRPTGTTWPVMLAAVTDYNGQLQAIHRTYLSQDSKSKAPITPVKMTFGLIGGFVVHLGMPINHVAVTEGIETALSVQQATGIPTWAAISAGGMEKLILPSTVCNVTICADNDLSGIGKRVAEAADRRWQQEGKKVHLAIPPFPGQDFNDLLLMETCNAAG